MSNSGSHTDAPSADNKFSIADSKPHDYMSAVPKTRPPMTDDQLAKLAVAREKALAVRRAQKVEKLKAEAARLEAPSEELQTSTEAVNTGVHPRRDDRGLREQRLAGQLAALRQRVVRGGPGRGARHARARNGFAQRAGQPVRAVFWAAVLN